MNFSYLDDTQKKSLYEKCLFIKKNKRGNLLHSIEHKFMMQPSQGYRNRCAVIEKSVM